MWSADHRISLQCFRRTKFRGNMQIFHRCSAIGRILINSRRERSMTKDLQNIRSRRFGSNTLNHKHKRYRRPKVRCAASSVHVTLREQLLRVAAESGFHIFTMSKAANHVRVTSTDMPYHGANFHGRGLKIRLCGLTVSTGALNAA